MTKQEIINEYLDRTGQTKQDLYGGAEFFGMEFIADLVQKALQENKKIVWKDEPQTGIGAMSYSLEDI